MKFSRVIGVDMESLQSESDESLHTAKALANLLTWGGKIIGFSFAAVGYSVGVEWAKQAGENQALAAAQAVVFIALEGYAVNAICSSAFARRQGQEINAELIARQQRSNTVE